MVGVAPEAGLVAVKVFDDAGNSSESLVLCGFDHVISLNSDGDTANDIDVMYMSFGEPRAWGDCQSDPLHAAVCSASAAGVIMVAGAGNSAVDAGNFVPAAFPEVISVSALTDFDAGRAGWPAASSCWSSSLPSATTLLPCSATTAPSTCGARRLRPFDLAEREIQDDQRHQHGDSPRHRRGRADAAAAPGSHRHRPWRTSGRRVPERHRRRCR